MNQSAGAATTTRRPAPPPSGPSAAAAAATSCCPMSFHPQFFVNTFLPTASLISPPSVAQQCLMGATTNQPSIQQQHQLPTTNLNQQQSVGSASQTGLPLLSGANNNLNQAAGLQQYGQQQAPQQPASQHQLQTSRQQAHQQQQQHSNYNTSLPAPTSLPPLHHLLANRHSVPNCVALAAALASASFPHFQQLHHHQAPITQLQQTTNTAANPAQQNTNSNSHNINSNAPQATSNQVPILNFNSYSAAQPFLNLPTPPPPAPVAAHLNSSNQHHQQLNQYHQQQPNGNSNSQAVSGPATTQPANQVASQPPSHRPLATNTTLNSVANQQTSYRASAPPMQQQAAPTAAPSQQTTIGETLPIGNIFNDEALNSIFNDHLRRLIFSQFLGGHQFAPAPPVPQAAAPLNQQNRQHESNTQPPSGQQPQIQPVIPAQQAAQVAPQAQQSQTQQQAQSLPETVNEQQQYQIPANQASNQNRVMAHDNFAQTNSGPYAPPSAQQQQLQSGPIHHNPAAQPEPTANQQTIPAPQSLQQPVPTQQRTIQPPTIPPPIPFYTLPQMEQALAFLANPQVANNLFSQVFNIYLQGGLRAEHHAHNQHHSSHHYHHHMHGAHHHHHGSNGQQNGQDVTMPLDSLAISESKPRGLNRAEIESLTPYVQMNEKDSRSCVICLSKFELKSKIRPLPCNHAFHAKCVDKWLRANRTCPICRRDALKTHVAKIKRI